ncbi:YraN family protein [Candidatus Falkowbacteria bacterium]|nr:YraN family protein [Candidatus Falkowbacteria bacterium]
MDNKILIGKFGQQLAAEFLQKRNYIILLPNFYSRFGEIDLVAEKDRQIIFVEVKTRLGRNFGLPEDALNFNKSKKIKDTALEYLTKNNINSDNYRFDLVAIEIDKIKKRAQIRHYKNVI